MLESALQGNRGPSTQSADRGALYLTCFDAPRETVSARGPRNAVPRVTVVGTGARLDHKVTSGRHEVPRG
jgi:alpha-L-fucosidase